MHAHTCDDFYSAMNRKETSPPMRIQITPESIVLSERVQKEDKDGMITLVRAILNVKFKAAE